MPVVTRGRCPVCRKRSVFRANGQPLRAKLRCSNCDSIPRERAFAWALDTFAPNWRDLVLHECSPAPSREVSARMQRECRRYVGTQYWPDRTPGEVREDGRCENLEALTFEDGSIDLHCHLDVMEHVNRPDLCFSEMQRTLRPGGMMIFTTPVYEGKVVTERRAEYTPDGIRYLAEAEYHGNPISDQGALVTFHYGSDLPEWISRWAPDCSVNMTVLNDPHTGVLGKFREVFVVTRMM